MHSKGPRLLVVLAAGAAILFGVSVARAQQNSSLGELARKEAERRKALKETGKVLAPKDLPKPNPNQGASAPATPSAAAKPAADDRPQPPGEVKDEAWWRQRMGGAREELRRNEMFAEALQTRINSLTQDFASRDDPYQRSRIAEDRAKATSELERLRIDMDIQKKKVADIEEEARKAGVPPGWIR